MTKRDVPLAKWLTAGLLLFCILVTARRNCIMHGQRACGLYNTKRAGAVYNCAAAKVPSEVRNASSTAQRKSAADSLGGRHGML